MSKEVRERRRKKEERAHTRETVNSLENSAVEVLSVPLPESCGVIPVCAASAQFSFAAIRKLQTARSKLKQHLSKPVSAAAYEGVSVSQPLKNDQKPSKANLLFLRECLIACRVLGSLVGALVVSVMVVML